ncbi:MAG: ATP-binding cassette domain-containing protein [Spirochaetia bacterium]|nr:ATP-binding cassette domain-containing protein [Spirochaetia bacterium]
MLEIKNLKVGIYGKEVLKGVSLTIPDGETHVLFGPNGSGKTSLLMTVMGYPQYKITGGSIMFNGRELNSMPIDERAMLGIGMFFQRPPSIKGIKLSDITEIIKAKSGTRMDPAVAAKALNLEYLMPRDINNGFSGGEIKRSELMQLFAQKPAFMMFDEPESGVDIENMKLIGSKIRNLLERDVDKTQRTKSSLIITHTGYILDYADADYGYTLLDGVIKCRHDARKLFEDIQHNGFRECDECLNTK